VTPRTVLPSEILGRSISHRTAPDLYTHFGHDVLGQSLLSPSVLGGVGDGSPKSHNMGNQGSSLVARSPRVGSIPRHFGSAQNAYPGKVRGGSPRSSLHGRIRGGSPQSALQGAQVSTSLDCAVSNAEISLHASRLPPRAADETGRVRVRSLESPPQRVRSLEPPVRQSPSAVVQKTWVDLADLSTLRPTQSLTHASHRGGPEAWARGQSGSPKHAAERLSRNRPHVLEVDLDQLALLPGAPEVFPFWFESVEYFVSLHPSEGDARSPELPSGVPQATVCGAYLVSCRTPARSHVGDSPSQPTVHFNHKMRMRVERVDPHMKLFLWRRRSNLLSEETSLIGFRPLPLRDTEYYHRCATWDIWDVVTGQAVAEIRCRFAVHPTPGCIRLLHLVDVRPTSVTLHWSAPIDGHAVLLGYRIDILLFDGESSWWSPVVECEMSTEFVVTDLKPDTAYMFNVRAVNEAGVGEPCECEVATAPVEIATVVVSEICSAPNEDIGSL